MQPDDYSNQDEQGFYDGYPPQPRPDQYAEYEYNQQPPAWVYAFMPDYTRKAVITFFLYFCGYIPGLISNIAWLSSALSTRARFGRSPGGLGCLILLLFFFTAGPVLLSGLGYFLLLHLY